MVTDRKNVEFQGKNIEISIKESWEIEEKGKKKNRQKIANFPTRWSF